MLQKAGYEKIFHEKKSGANTTKSVALKATEQEIDTSTGSGGGRLMIGLLSIVAEFETDLRSKIGHL